MKLFNSKFWCLITLPFSLINLLVMVLRNRIYDSGLMKRGNAGCPVICIGNITAGGSGKTPVVMAIAERLQAMGFKPAVLSRGYGGRGSREAELVSDGRKILVPAGETGDEPILIAGQLSGVPVAVAKRRINGARLLQKRFQIDCLLLDDGFQHRRLERDLDIVLINSLNPWGNGCLLPGGPLREPVSALARAGLIIMTNRDSSQDSLSGGIVRSIQRKSKAPVLSCFHKPENWITWPEQMDRTLSQLHGKRVLPFAGLGNPEGFIRTLESLSFDTTHFVRFRDHHWYRVKELKRLESLAEKTGAACLVTTEKDFKRIPAEWNPGPPCFALHIKIDFSSDSAELDRILKELLSHS